MVVTDFVEKLKFGCLGGPFGRLRRTVCGAYGAPDSGFHAADRLDTLGGPSGSPDSGFFSLQTQFAVYRLRVLKLGRPFGLIRLSAGGLQTQSFQCFRKSGGPLYYFRFWYLGGPFVHSRRSA